MYIIFYTMIHAALTGQLYEKEKVQGSDYEYRHKSGYLVGTDHKPAGRCFLYQKRTSVYYGNIRYALFHTGL